MTKRESRHTSHDVCPFNSIYLGSKPETSWLTAPAEPVLAHGTELLKLDGNDFVLTTTDVSNGLWLDLAEDFFPATSLEFGPRDLGYELRVWGQAWCQLLSNAI